MKAVPMIFNAAMVSALVAGRKTVTRRPLNIPDGWELKDSKPSKITSSHPKKGKWGAIIRRETFPEKYQHDLVIAPCYIGDLIYVRETFCVGRIDEDDANQRFDQHLYVSQCSGDDDYLPKQWLESEGICIDEVFFRPSIHMPRKASRLTLKVTDLRIEKAQEITAEQAMKEGITHHSMNCPKAEFGQLWNEIYGNWSDNPYVWVIEFEVIHKNVDEVIKQLQVGEIA